MPASEMSATSPASLLFSLGIVVDDFTVRSPSCVYLLSHWHADHVRGLTSNFDCSFIYCSEVTRFFLLLDLPRLRPKIRALALDELHSLPHPKDPDNKNATVNVRLIDSNHCPGSVMFLLQCQSRTILHTGDCRYDPLKFHAGSLHSLIGCLDLVVLDATFGHPKYAKFCIKLQSAQLTAEAITKYWLEHSSSAACSNCRLNQLAPRVFLACDCLGIEELLTHVCSSLRCQLFVPPNMITSHRQLGAMIQTRSQLTKEPDANGRVIHAAESRGFVQFTQRDRLARSKRHKAKVGCTCPLVPALYIKPSTMYFAVNSRNSGHRIRTAASYNRSISNIDKEAVADDDDEGDESSAADCVPVQVSPWFSVDRFGVTHVLYSMHSSFDELMSMLSFLQPNVVAMHSSPAIEDLMDNPVKQFQSSVVWTRSGPGPWSQMDRQNSAGPFFTVGPLMIGKRQSC